MKRRHPPPQDDVIDAFVKALNEDGATKYRIVDRPDRRERNEVAVDYILRDDTREVEIAVELSSTWRSESAGKEDSDWLVWIEAVRGIAHGRLPGEFRLMTPMRISASLSARDFAEALVSVAQQEAGSLRRLRAQAKGRYFTIAGIEVLLSYFKEGSGIVSFGRLMTEDDTREFREQVRRLVSKKSEKLLREKQARRETWLVFYNTFWVAMSPDAVKDAVIASLTPEYDHIDHVAVVYGDPPNEAFLDIIR